MPIILLVYQCGGSDLQFTRDEMPRNVPMAERIDLAREFLDAGYLEFDSEFDQRSLVISDGNGPVLQLPILGETLSHIRDVVGVDGSSLYLLPLVTRQAAQASPVDTFPMVGLFNDLSVPLARVLGMSVKIVGQDEELFISNAADSDHVAAFYEEIIWARYESLVNQLKPDRVFVQATGGTPAMTMAARVFSRDASATFLYTPGRRRTKEVELYRRERRRQTGLLIDELLKFAQFGGAALALGQKWNGFTPLVGDHPEDDRLLAFKALERWWRREYHMATSIRKSDCLPDSIYQTWRCLQKKRLGRREKYPELVRDGLLRLLSLARSEDQLRFIGELNAFVDLQLNLAVMMKRERFDGSTASARRVLDLDPASDWNDFRCRDRYVAQIYAADDESERAGAIRVLCELLRGHLRTIRNELVHGGIRLSVDELSEPLREKGLRTCKDLGSSMLTLLGLAIRSAKDLGVCQYTEEFAGAIDEMAFSQNEHGDDELQSVLAKANQLAEESGWEQVRLD